MKQTFLSVPAFPHLIAEPRRLGPLRLQSRRTHTHADRVDTLLLDWKIRVRDAHARLPDSIPSALKPLALVWVNHINAHPEDWEFGFQLELAEARFYGAASLHARQIWENSWSAILKQIAENTGIQQSVIQDSANETLNRFKGFLEERRPR